MTCKHFHAGDGALSYQCETHWQNLSFLAEEVRRLREANDRFRTEASANHLASLEARLSVARKEYRAFLRAADSEYKVTLRLFKRKSMLREFQEAEE